jgi:predicted dehydrogenase
MSARDPYAVDTTRRRLVGAAGSSLAASAFGGLMTVSSGLARSETTPAVRWGFVGTGAIANSMARVVKTVPSADLVAVSSRRMESAKAFADSHGAKNAFDSWVEMAAWDGVDAIYVATPTSVREEICLAAAANGKHVLAEKPFATLDSVRRITAACRENGVGFMDGTHFVHHPRTAAIRAAMSDKVGWAWSVDSAFQFNLTNRQNIRFNPDLEPMGAIGDAGWYNMRAAVEYLSPDAGLATVSAYLRRDKETGAAISGSGVLVFDDGSTSTWNCGFDSGAVIMDLRISGTEGSISLDNFLSQDPDASANYLHRGGGWGANATRETVRVESAGTGAALMFRDFAMLVDDESLREHSMRSSEITQSLLDAAWESATGNVELQG